MGRGVAELLENNDKEPSTIVKIATGQQYTAIANDSDKHGST